MFSGSSSSEFESKRCRLPPLWKGGGGCLARPLGGRCRLHVGHGLDGCVVEGSNSSEVVVEGTIFSVGKGSGFSVEGTISRVVEGWGGSCVLSTAMRIG